MLKKARENLVQTLLVLIVFLVFLSSGSGLLDFGFHSTGAVRLHTDLFGISGFALPPVVKSIQFIVLLLTGMVLTVALPMLNPIAASLLTLGATIPTLVLGFHDGGGHVLLPMEFALLTILVIFGVNVLLSYFRLTHSRSEMIGVFRQYIPPQLVDEISRNPDQVSLEGDARRLTVFFCDLQHFSGVAEQLNPKQLATLLNEYFTDMTEVLFRHGATIDKYIGDSIMAFWGAPLAVPDHATRAVLAAFEMHKVIERLAAGFVRRGWPGPTMGIGINTGMMNVGNMGSKYRIAYTVVGDAVNLASRLESLTRTYSVPTIVGEATRSECTGVVFRTLDIVQVRGKHNRTRIYQPVCLESDMSDALRDKLERHEQAVELYLEGQHGKAESALESLRAESPDDEFYLAILRKLRQHPAENRHGNA